MEYFTKKSRHQPASFDLRSIGAYTLYFIFLVLTWIWTLSAQAQTGTIASGSFIVNMGVTPQTVSNGLKPYGLVYDIIKNYDVPVIWSISKTKAKDGADFTYNAVPYKGGSFIIPKEYINAAITARITYWTGLGVQGVYTTSDITVPIYDTLTSFPKLMLDTLSGNESIIGQYYTNAGIPSSAYKKGVPANLTQCFDIWSNPHADPDWSSHGFLYDFVTVSKGHIWSECHTVSMLEGCTNAASPYQQLNFLTSSGLKCYANNKCGPVTETHGGNPNTPYTYNYASDPIMQFIGTMDDATKNGSEKWYQPVSTGQWNNTTKRLVTTADGISPREGVIMAYGPAYGISSYGWVMYEGGHDLNNGNSTDLVAAQRAYFNFLLFTGGKKKLDVNANFPLALYAGSSYPISATVNGGSPAYTYQWSSLHGGSFDNPNSVNATYYAPNSQRDTTDIIMLKVTDACGRVNFRTGYVAISRQVFLPVSLVFFDAMTIDNKYVLIQWNTASELNNKLFTVERSRDGITFETIAEVPGAGNSSSVKNYSFVDETPYHGISYYRLKQTDFDNTTCYSRMVTATVNVLQFKIFPNPVSSTEVLHINCKAFHNQDVLVELSDLSGKKIMKKYLVATENAEGTTLYLYGIPPGIYSLTFTSGNFYERQNLAVH